jgi:glycosyltransferase involved in cell wall biosynthesis
MTPVRGGGQARLFNLFANLAPQIQTEVITLGQETDEAFSREVSPGLRETRIPKSQAHSQAEAEISREVEWFPITDVAFPDLASLTPDYLCALEQSCRDADVVVASHPYVLQAIEAVSDKPVWYEAQDVEYLLKKEVIPKTARGLALVDQVFEIERRCCERATVVMVCSDVDLRELIRLYDLPEGKMRVVPNGVDTRKVRFRSREQCVKAKRELGIAESFSAVFIGSWHEPNLQAVKAIMNAAVECPNVQFLILGSSCLAFENQVRPENVGLLGVVDDATKDLVLRIADIALNPVQQGSGTNLKMLEYAAAGVPIITTAFGMRGLGFRRGHDVFVEEIGDFPEAIATIRAAPLSSLQEMADHARQHVAKYFDWRAISRRLLASL